MSFTDRVMAFFRAHEGLWIEAVRLEPIGGRQAWRSRVAEARIQFKASGEGDILNRQRRQTIHGNTFVLSEYLFQSTPAQVDPVTQGHDQNSWGLR